MESIKAVSAPNQLVVEAPVHVDANANKNSVSTNDGQNEFVISSTEEKLAAESLAVNQETVVTIEESRDDSHDERNGQSITTNGIQTQSAASAEEIATLSELTQPVTEENVSLVVKEKIKEVDKIQAPSTSSTAQQNVEASNFQTQTAGGKELAQKSKESLETNQTANEVKAKNSSVNDQIRVQKSEKALEATQTVEVKNFSPVEQAIIHKSQEVVEGIQVSSSSAVLEKSAVEVNEAQAKSSSVDNQTMVQKSEKEGTQTNLVSSSSAIEDKDSSVHEQAIAHKSEEVVEGIQTHPVASSLIVEAKSSFADEQAIVHKSEEIVEEIQTHPVSSSSTVEAKNSSADEQAIVHKSEEIVEKLQTHPVLSSLIVEENSSADDHVIVHKSEKVVEGIQIHPSSSAASEKPGAKEAVDQRVGMTLGEGAEAEDSKDLQSQGAIPKNIAVPDLPDSEPNLQNQPIPNQTQTPVAAFTTEVNLNISPNVLTTENQTLDVAKNDTTQNTQPKIENVIIIEPKKIYVEKSSTVIQVMDPTNPDYGKVEQITPSASESESGTDNNEYEFLDASDLSEANQQLNADKRSQRNSVSTLSITLINHSENNAETPKAEVAIGGNESVLQENALIGTDNSLQVSEDTSIVAAEENNKDQYRAVLVPVDKPFGTKLSRKQKKSMKELQKLARERAKSKLASQLSTSSSESGGGSGPTDVTSVAKAVDDRPIELEPPVKSTTVVQLAQNSSKTVPVPPKRPSKIPISRQRSVPKGEAKTPELTPSKIPIKTTATQIQNKAQKVPETPKTHVGDATPEFTNSASIVLKPAVRNHSLRSQKSEEIASEMENSVQIVKDLNRKFSMAQNKSLSKKSSIDSTTSSKQLSYTKSLDNDSDSSVSDSNVEEILEHSSGEISYEEFDEYDEDIVESDTEDYNNFDKEQLESAAELNINLTEIREKVNELTSNLNEKRLNYKKPNSYIEETCESSEDYLSEEELEEDEIEETSDDDVEHLAEKLKNDLNVEIKQPTELELMQVRTHFQAKSNKKTCGIC